MNITQHLADRHLDINLHRPSIDESAGVATFFLYNLSGQLVGYQQYRPGASKEKNNCPKDGRYFTYCPRGVICVFGVESLHLTSGVVFITEGVFDAARLTSRGVSALAVLSNDPTRDVRNFIGMLGRTTVAVCDNDPAGRKLAKLADHAVFTEDKDLGDSSDEFVTTLINRFVSF